MKKTALKKRRKYCGTRRALAGRPRPKKAVLKKVIRSSPARCKRRFVRTGDFTVYILKCADGTFYTGHTNNINARIGLHRSGRGAKYVRSRLPFRLVFRKSYRYFKAAFAEEFRIKALSRREKMELIKTMVRRHSVAR